MNEKKENRTIHVGGLGHSVWKASLEGSCESLHLRMHMYMVPVSPLPKNKRQTGSVQLDYTVADTRTEGSARNNSKMVSRSTILVAASRNGYSILSGSRAVTARGSASKTSLTP